MLYQIITHDPECGTMERRICKNKREALKAMSEYKNGKIDGYKYSSIIVYNLDREEIAVEIGCGWTMSNRPNERIPLF